MFQTTSRARKAGVAALVAVTSVAGLAFPTTAGAAPATAGDLTLLAVSTPTIGIGKTAQAAGALHLDVTPGDTVTAGDQILIFVNDTDGSACAGGDTLAFTSLPTVALTGTATVVSSLDTSGAGCGTDTLRLNVTGSGSLTADITGIAYSVGATATTGQINVDGTLNGGGIIDGGADNAFASTAIFTGNNPPTGADELDFGSYVISPLVIAEQAASAADGDLCIYFNDTIEDTPAPAPTVVVTGGTDTATLTTDTTSDFIFVDVTPSGPASTSTFTISGLRMETDNGFGVQRATVYADDNDTCNDGDGVQLSDGDTTIGYVGTVTRYGGADRFSTAQIIFESEFACSPDVIIARADQFPDALAASYLAGQMDTGILLTNTDSVPAATLNALRNEGVLNVFLMGGTGAISAGVATTLDATPAYNCGGTAIPDTTLNVQRIAGADRFETAQNAAEFPGLGAAGTLDITPTDGIANPAKTAIVASGLNFPDALAAGPLAYAGDCCSDSLPMLLTQPGSVPPATLAALTNLSVVNVVVVGGTAAVSDAAVAQLTAAGYHVRRIAGASRQATAAALATAMLTEWDYDDDDASFARGDGFADSLTGATAAGTDGQVVLLTSSPTGLSAETSAFVSDWERVVEGFDELDDFEIYGGTAAVSAAVTQAMLNAASLQK
jgi:putative cell wall-binding protein